jgi:hypothetical protein
MLPFAYSIAKCRVIGKFIANHSALGLPSAPNGSALSYTTQR